MSRSTRVAETPVVGRRAIDDPAALIRAAHIVRVALARQRPTLDELTTLSDVDGSAAA